MPEDAHAAVRKTCVLLLGELSEWIDRHAECLEPCLHFLLRALHDARLAAAAATSLQVCSAVYRVSRDVSSASASASTRLTRTRVCLVCRQSVCRGCRSRLGAQVAGLLGVSRALDELPLPPAHGAGLLRGLAAAIGDLPPQQVRRDVEQAVQRLHVHTYISHLASRVV